MDEETRCEIILQLLDTSNEIDALSVMDVLSVDTITIANDFKKLIASWDIMQTSPWRYSKPFDVRKFFAMPVQDRPEKSYNESLLEDYTPKTESFLWEDSLITLQEKHGNSIYDFQKNFGFMENFYLSLSYYSNKLSGGEINKLDSEILLKFWHSPKWQRFIHSQRILNYKKILDAVIQHPWDIEFSFRDFRKMHGTLLKWRIAETLHGKLRDFELIIAETSYRPLRNSFDLENAFMLFITKLQKIDNPFEKSFFIFIFLPYILPFSDGNVELSRIMANIPLIQSSCPPLLFEKIDRSEYNLAYRAFYELNDISLLRKMFIWML